MIRTLVAFAVLVTVAVSPALADTANKDFTPTPYQDPTVPPVPSERGGDWIYNTGGAEDFVPTTGGSNTGWGEWFITTVLADAGQELKLVEFGFPCGGPPTGPYGWVVWYNLGGYMPPAGDATTAEDYGMFTPTDPDPGTFPPTVYTYVDVSAEGLIVADGSYFCFGYDNTGIGGQTDFNGVQTWAWYSGLWDPDVNYGRTAILQVKGDYNVPIATQTSTWGAVKALFQ